jgi:hypothetical protein
VPSFGCPFISCQINTRQLARLILVRKVMAVLSEVAFLRLLLFLPLVIFMAGTNINVLTSRSFILFDENNMIIWCEILVITILHTRCCLFTTFTTFIQQHRVIGAPATLELLLVLVVEEQDIMIKMRIIIVKRQVM